MNIWIPVWVVRAIDVFVCFVILLDVIRLGLWLVEKRLKRRRAKLQ